MSPGIGIGISNALMRRGGGIPFKSDALFWLDGTILLSGSDYYFVDKKNGKNFLITGYDFPSGWTKGFPYKSAATISAPAGDATLIAADINNFLYDSGGTPNQIPIVSLYQDVDYEHKLFTRHEDQRLVTVAIETIIPGVYEDIEIETYEPRVVDIVLYATVKSGAGLTACQTYFGVPAEITSNVKWISKMGNDSTGDGSKANPWLTLQNANASSSAGDTIYVKSGLYKEDNVGDLSGSFWITKSLNIKALGLVTIQSYKTSYIILLYENNINVRIDGAIIGNDSAVTGGIINSILQKSPATLFLNRCKMNGGSSAVEGTYISSSVSIQNSVIINISNRILTGSNEDIDLSTNKITDDATILADNAATETKSVIIKHNNLSSCNLYNGYSLILQIFDNFLNKNIGLNAADNDVSDSSVVLIAKNILIPNGSNSFILLSKNYNNVNISENILLGSNATLEVGIRAGYEQTTLFINKNIVNAGSGKAASITAGSNTSIAKSIIIQKNKIISDAVGNFNPLQIGRDAVAIDSDSYSGVIAYNQILGTENTSVVHGVISFYQKSITIKYNYCRYFVFGFLIKTNGQDLSDSPIMYNISEQCGSGISCKGGLNQKIIGNTIINAGSNGIYIAPNGGDDCTGTILKNNIIYEDGELSSYVAIRFNVGSPPSESSHNIIYSKNNYDKFNAGSSNINLEQWQLLGFDIDAIITDPLIDSNYHLQHGSPAIDSGEDIGIDYDDGLDVSTDWGSDSETPFVVTKQQSANWDIGAYIH